MPKNCYLLLGGGSINASSAPEFVYRMRDMSFYRGDSLIDFMEEVSDRCWLYSESIIRTDSCDHFLADLIRNDFVVQIKFN